MDTVNFYKGDVTIDGHNFNDAWARGLKDIPAVKAVAAKEAKDNEPAVEAIEGKPAKTAEQQFIDEAMNAPAINAAGEVWAGKTNEETIALLKKAFAGCLSATDKPAKPAGK